MRLELALRHRHADGFVLEADLAADGPRVAIVGPSGSGKSTLLALVAGVLPAQQGRIALDGAALLDTARGVALPPERRELGVLFQDDRLLPHRRVAGNLRYGAGRRAVRPVPFDAVVDLLELGPLLDRRPASLSGGERRRVALGRALLRGPRLLLLDEPTTGLDAELKRRLLPALAARLDEWAIPALLVSHDEAAVAALATAVHRIERHAAGGRLRHGAG